MKSMGRKWKFEGRGMHKIEFFILVRRVDGRPEVYTKNNIWTKNINLAKKHATLDKAWKHLGKEKGIAVGMYAEPEKKRYASGPEYSKGVN